MNKVAGFASGRGELATIIAMSFYLIQICAAAMEPVQNCPHNNPCRETNQILFLQVPQGAPFYPDSAKGIMDPTRGASFHASEAILYDSLGVAGMAIHHYGEGICALRMLLAAYPDTRLRLVYEARCDSYRHRIDVLERRAAARRPETPTAFVAAGVALLPTGIQHRMSAMP